MPKKYYAVKNGRQKGVFYTWDECKKHTTGYPNAIFKSFTNEQDAINFLEDKNISNEKSKKIYHDSEEDIISNMEPNTMIAYIDGSYEDSIKYFSYAGIMFFDGKSEDFAFASNDENLISMRNVSGEVKASMYVIQKAYDYNMKKVTIYFDYNGIQMWAIGSWKANNELTKLYREFCNDMYKKLDIEFVKVKSHTNVKYNEYVDKLAKKVILDIKNKSF